MIHYVYITLLGDHATRMSVRPHICVLFFSFFRRRRRQYDEGRKDITATGLG